MKSKTSSKTKNMERFHRQLVDQITSHAAPVKRMPSAWVQWLLWMALSLVVMALFLMKIHIQNNAGQVLAQMPPLVFILTAFTGAALAAWEAIASSVPGRQTGAVYRWAAVVILLALVLIPFAFFAAGEKGFDLIQSFKDGLGCVQYVSLVGIAPWVVLGWMISRNAAFRPGWTGAWSGVSAFLLGTVTVQLHCPNWERGHMVAAHLLPVAFFIFLTTFLGAFWFSRWRKGS